MTKTDVQSAVFCLREEDGQDCNITKLPRRQTKRRAIRAIRLKSHANGGQMRKRRMTQMNPRMMRTFMTVVLTVMMAATMMTWMLS